MPRNKVIDLTSTRLTTGSTAFSHPNFVPVATTEMPRITIFHPGRFWILLPYNTATLIDLPANSYVQFWWRGYFTTPNSSILVEMGDYHMTFDVVDDPLDVEASFEVIETNRMVMGVHEEVFFKIRLFGRYKSRMLRFPNNLFGTSLPCRAVWFDYHPDFRVVWDDFDQSLIIIDRVRGTELCYGDSFDFVVRGRAFFSSVR